MVANGDLKIVGSREERPFCRGERVPPVHAPYFSDMHRWRLEPLLIWFNI